MPFPSPSNSTEKALGKEKEEVGHSPAIEEMRLATAEPAILGFKKKKKSNVIKQELTHSPGSLEVIKNKTVKISIFGHFEIISVLPDGHVICRGH